MRYWLIMLLLFIPVSMLSAQTETAPARLTESITAMGMTIYYPDTLTASVTDELIFTFQDELDFIVITPPQALDAVWNIAQSDISTMMASLYDQMRSQPQFDVFTDGVVAVTVGSYRAEYFALMDEWGDILPVYMVATPNGIFSARLHTDDADLQSKTNLLMAMLKVAELSSDLPDGVIGRVAPVPDVQMSERVTALDGTITYQMPFGWVFDEDSLGGELIADSQATIDIVRDDGVVSPDGMAVGFIMPDSLPTMGLDTTSPYLAMRGLQDLWGLDTEVNPTWTYTNLPYAVYIYAFGDELVEGGYLVALTIPESEAVMMLLVFTQDFERDEAVLVAIMNSIRLVE